MTQAQCRIGSDVDDSPAHLRSFRQKFEKELVRVLAVYPAANVETSATGLVLKPSRTHVGRNGRAELR